MASYGLKPLISDYDRKIPQFGVCDIESAKGWINFRVIGFHFKHYDKDTDELIEDRYEHFLNLGEFCDFVFSEDNPHDVIFAHFGGRYDFSFILKEFFHSSERYRIGTMLPRGSGLLCFEVSTFKKYDLRPNWASDDDIVGKSDQGEWLIKDRTITFRDSSAMLPFGLASLTENFKVEHKKGEIDYDSIDKVTPELLTYLESDCRGLTEVIEKYFRWSIIRRAGPAMTVASQALRVFRTFMKKEIPCLRPSVDAFVRESYFGGRTEIFKPFFEQRVDDGMLRSYDVNSLYPSVMRDLSFPGGFKFETQLYHENEMGFYDVEVEVPDMYVPPLAIRYEGMEDRLIFPTGIFRGKWSTLELNYAVSIGCKIRKIYKGMIFHNIGFIFKDYVNHLYEMRKKSEKNSVDNVLTKLILNSSYGRFGLNLERERLTFDQGQIGVVPHMEIPLTEDGKHVIRLVKEPVTLDSSFSNVAIAAWVTSGARIHLHKLIMEAPHGMYYCDTDSLKTTALYARNDADLGQLKLEYKSKRACFLLPKTYLEDTTEPMFKFFGLDGKEIKGMKTSKKLVMKGFDKKKISMFTAEDFMSCLEGDMRRLRTMNPEKFAPLRTAIKKGDFLALLEESPRQIRTRYNKRKIVKVTTGQRYDTEPLHLKDGVITNLDMSILKKWKAPTENEMDDIAYHAMMQAKADGAKQEYLDER